MNAALLPPRIRERTIAKARTLIEALPFMQDHWGKTIVIKIGGAAIHHAAPSRSFAQDVSLIQHAGVHPVIVHGGGPQVTELSERLGISTRFVDGVRFTDEPTLDVATMVLAGRLNTRIVGSLAAEGVPAVGLTGLDGGSVVVRRQPEPDLGFVGEVVHVDDELLRTLLGSGFVPVIASIAADDSGQTYNLNADVMAAEIAAGLVARKLVYVSDVPGVIGPEGDLCSELGVTESLELLAHETAISGGMIPKLESAIRAVRAGVPRVHLLDGRVEHALVLELFTAEGIGTMLVADQTAEVPVPDLEGVAT